MNTDEMIIALRKLQKQHKNDVVGFGETRWHDICRDVADRLEE